MRNGLAAFSLNGNINAFDLALTKTSGGVTVNSLLATTTEIYAGGDFDAAGTTTRRDFVGQPFHQSQLQQQMHRLMPTYTQLPLTVHHSCMVARLPAATIRHGITSA